MSLSRFNLSLDISNKTKYKNVANYYIFIVTIRTLTTMRAI